MREGGGRVWANARPLHGPRLECEKRCWNAIITHNAWLLHAMVLHKENQNSKTVSTSTSRSEIEAAID